MNIQTGWILSLVITVLGLGVLYQSDNYRFVNNQQGYTPAQPIAFSHKTHSGDNGIPCLYCHSAAESSRHAGVPAANVCMNCHTEIKPESPEVQKVVDALEKDEPIEWVKVNSVGDFVYFNHSIHIDRDIECSKCHGPVETMQQVVRDNKLNMGWCIDCHRDYTQQVLKLDPGSQVLVDCSVCHY